MSTPGRSCPVTYRYRPEALAEAPRLAADTLYVVGGLYGNLVALRAVLRRAERELGAPAAIVFNGDFHWLDLDPADFHDISQTVLAHHAIKGNVEAELASASAAGCGCAYPDYIDDAVVERSDQIIIRLRATARRFPDLVARLGRLPSHITASVGSERVGIVHGDPESLAGWGLALEAMEPGDHLLRRQLGWHGRPTPPAKVQQWLRRAGVTVLASTHTGLPYAQDFHAEGRRRLVINNGAAGLGNFAGTTYGVVTRLSASPTVPTDSLYGTTIGSLRCDAVPVVFDVSEWMARFVAQWPPGSPGHRSYLARITCGTQLRLEQATRGSVQLTTSIASPEALH
jgi:hypothetical protein